MKRTLLFLCVTTLLAGFALFPPVEAPSTWSVDHSHSKIGFKVRHLGISSVRGDFADYNLSVSMDGTDLSSLSTSATIQTKSISTDNERRDNHLMSPDFFSAEEFPTMTFESKEVRNVDGNSFDLVGDLTIRDVTQEVVLEAEFLGMASMGEEERAGFEASITIDRLEYGLSWQRLTEAGGFIVGHDVEITLELELTKDTP